MEKNYHSTFTLAWQPRNYVIVVVDSKNEKNNFSLVQICKVENILKGSLDSIPSPSVKIQIRLQKALIPLHSV